jgi:hypothetical protein
MEDVANRGEKHAEDSHLHAPHSPTTTAPPTPAPPIRLMPGQWAAAAGIFHVRAGRDRGQESREGIRWIASVRRLLSLASEESGMACLLFYNIT